jgi:hypothetical protein
MPHSRVEVAAGLALIDVQSEHRSNFGQVLVKHRSNSRLSLGLTQDVTEQRSAAAALLLACNFATASQHCFLSLYFTSTGNLRQQPVAKERKNTH